VEGLACRLLRDEILPALERERRRPLAQAVDRAVARSRLDALETLSAREKRELLELLEREVERSPRRPDPRAIVRLTSVLSAAPAADTALARSLAPPAR
jgi:hypothetical protein